MEKFERFGHTEDKNTLELALRQMAEARQTDTVDEGEKSEWSSPEENDLESDGDEGEGYERINSKEESDTKEENMDINTET